MFVDNKTTYLKREVMSAVAKLFFEDHLISEIDKLPIKLIPRNTVPHRCCIQKDREMIRQRVIAALGFGLDDEDVIDNTLLSDFAKQSLEREKPEMPIMSFIKEGCNACVKVNYYVTEVCRNCVAKPCIVNCPKNAISSDERKSEINSEKCVNCGICMKVCPYHAIVYVPVPCEESCPVGAIRKNEDGTEMIDYDKCIFCGKCIRACPFGAVVEKSQIIEVMKLITGEGKTAALVAPAIAGQFPGGIKQLCSAIRELGFDYVVEVALGADITAQVESEEFIERIAKGDPLMGTSCCPAYLEAVRKHVGEFQKYVSHAKTPMEYTARLVREKYPDVRTVFVGPCVAKRQEALNTGSVDHVITFEELGALLIGKGIDVLACKESEFDFGKPTAEGRYFPVSEGVAAAVKKRLAANGKDELIKPVFINGFHRKNISLLNAYATGKAPGNLIEVMSCEGGCIFGPGVVSNPKIAKNKLDAFVKESLPDKNN